VAEGRAAYRSEEWGLAVQSPDLCHRTDCGLVPRKRRFCYLSWGTGQQPFDSEIRSTRPASRPLHRYRVDFLLMRADDPYRPLRAASISHTYPVRQPGYSQANSILAALIVRILFLFFLRWLANRAALLAMDKPFPPRPALFLTLMLKLNPSRSKQLFSNLRVTHPILQSCTVLNGSFNLI